jgi:RHS repeat-associated protein
MTSCSPVARHYHWDFDAGNRMTLFYSLRDGTAVYGHDNRNQLTDAAYTYQNPEDYEYDENGNRINGGFTVGYNNRLTSDGTYTYQYDAEGNRVAKFIDNDGNWALSAGDTDVTQYAWDHRNRLIGVAFRDVQEDLTTKAIEYVYDPFNRLIARKLDPDGEFGSAAVEEAYYIYDGNQIVAQLDGPSEDDITNRYLWGPAIDQLLADEQVTDPTQPGAVVWPFIDHLNTIRDLAVVENGTTRIATHRAFDAFGLRTDQQHFDLTGAPIAPTDPAAVDSIFNHAGRFVDPETGQEYDWNRWYDLFTHAWTAEDPNPTQFGGGDVNLYRYVGNGPLVSTDPAGLSAEVDPGSYWGGGWNPMNWVHWFGFSVAKFGSNLYYGNYTTSANIRRQQELLEVKANYLASGDARQDQLRADIAARNRQPIPSEWADLIEEAELSVASTYGSVFSSVRYTSPTTAVYRLTGTSNLEARSVTVYRAQGRPLILVDDAGNVTFSRPRGRNRQGVAVHVGFSENRAKVLIEEKGRKQLIEFEVERGFLQKVRRTADPEHGVPRDRTRPWRVDVAYPDQYAIPPSMLDEFEKAIIPQSARVSTAAQ